MCKSRYKSLPCPNIALRGIIIYLETVVFHTLLHGIGLSVLLNIDSSVLFNGLLFVALAQMRPLSRVSLCVSYASSVAR